MLDEKLIDEAMGILVRSRSLRDDKNDTIEFLLSIIIAQNERAYKWGLGLGDELKKVEEEMEAKTMSLADVLRGPTELALKIAGYEHYDCFYSKE